MVQEGLLIFHLWRNILIMNETKLNIIKKVLGVDKWTLRENENIFPGLVFIFDERGRYIMDFKEKKFLRYNKRLIHSKIKSIFGINNKETRKLMKSLIGDYFNWRLKNPMEFTSVPDYIIEEHFNNE